MPAPARRWSLALAVTALGLVAASQSLVAPATPAAAAARPNIVLITADDMNASDMAWMPRTRELLGDRGVEITDFISNHPLCCPARAEILTGQMAHNNGVHSNDGPYGGYDDAASTRATTSESWLKDSGYRTAFVGKHLNNWPDVGTRQGGWTVFDPFYRARLQAVRRHDVQRRPPQRYPDTYTADLVGDLPRAYIKRFSASGAPFFIWASQLPPHKMTDSAGRWVYPFPARRHRDLYPGAVPAVDVEPLLQGGRRQRQAQLHLTDATVRRTTR